jgi:hypothetical protein
VELGVAVAQCFVHFGGLVLLVAGVHG